MSANRLALCLLTIFLLPGITLAQSELDGESVYVSGDSLVLRSLGDGESALDLIGNVRFFDRNRGIVASAYRGLWREQISKLRLEGGAAIYREGSWIYGPRAVIDSESERMIFPDGVLVVERDRTITAESAIFHFGEGGEGGEDRIIFRGSVRVIDSTALMIAESLDVFAGREEAIARGNVLIDLYRDNQRVSGREAFFDSDRIVVTGEPFMEEVDSTGARVGLLEGDTITIYPDEERVYASGGTLADYRDVVTEAGRTAMDADSRSVILGGSPVLTHQGETMSGDSMVIYFSDEDEIERVVVRGNATLLSIQDDSLLVEHSEATGDSIVLFFESGDLVRTDVIGGARSDRTIEDLVSDERERSHAEGDTIRFFIDGNDLTDVHIAGGASGNTVTVPLHATPEEEEEERVRYQGDRVVYQIAESRLTLRGHGHVEKGNTALDADLIRYDLDRSIITALGSPVLKDAGQQVDGERMIYNVKDGKGTIYEGVTAYDQGTCRGRRILRVGDQTLLVDHGIYTSCDKLEPHYYFSAKQMKIYTDKQTFVRPIVFHIGKLPVLWFPFYVFPLKGNRSSGFILPQVEFGFSESKGRFIRNGGYFWAINDYADLTFKGDFFQNSHWIGYLNGRYRKRYLLSGAINTSFKSSENGRRRWSVNASHNQDIGENTDLTMRANFVSDRSFRVEESTTLEELDRTLKSDLTLKKRWNSRSFTLQMTRTERLDQDRIDETLPSISYNQNQTEIFPPPEAVGGGNVERKWFNDIYYRYTSRLLNSRQEMPVSRDTTIFIETDSGQVALDTTFESLEREDNFGWNHDLRFTFSQKVGGWLGLTTRGNWKETWYDSDRLGQKKVRRGMGDASMSANTNIYGTWFPRIGPLDGLRHIMTPSASFSIKPKNPNHFFLDEDGDETDRFFNFGAFGSSRRTRSKSLGLSLTHKIQTKYLLGDEEVKKNDQLISISNSSSYNYQAKEKPWSDLSTSIRLQPLRSFSSELGLTHDVYSWASERVSLNSSYRFRGSLGGEADPGPEEGEEGFEYDPLAPDQRSSRRSDDPFEEDKEEVYRGDKRVHGEGRASSQVIPISGSLRHSISRGAPGSPVSQWLNSSLDVGLTKNWELSYQNRYDLEDSEIVSQSFRVIRDLHCWEASFRGRFSGDEWEYYFNIRVKAHREIFYEKGERRLGGF